MKKIPRKHSAPNKKPGSNLGMCLPCLSQQSRGSVLTPWLRGRTFPCSQFYDNLCFHGIPGLICKYMSRAACYFGKLSPLLTDIALQIPPFAFSKQHDTPRVSDAGSLKNVFFFHQLKSVRKAALVSSHYNFLFQAMTDFLSSSQPTMRMAKIQTKPM